MGIFLTILQGLSVVALAIVGLLKRRRVCVVLIAALIFISTSVLKEIESSKRENKLHKQTEEIRERLFSTLATKVMEAPKEGASFPVPKSTGQIQILSPSSDSLVNARTYVKGYVSNPKANVWLVIHPMDVSSYWVQPSITVTKKGTWKVLAYFGRASNIDVGKKFELIAVANPKITLKEGDVLGGWPTSEWSSEMIEVTRQ
jgi:hypothetical protein